MHFWDLYKAIHSHTTKITRIRLSFFLSFLLVRTVMDVTMFAKIKKIKVLHKCNWLTFTFLQLINICINSTLHLLIYKVMSHQHNISFTLPHFYQKCTVQLGNDSDTTSSLYFKNNMIKIGQEDTQLVLHRTCINFGFKKYPVSVIKFQSMEKAWVSHAIIGMRFSAGSSIIIRIQRSQAFINRNL